MRLAVDLPLRRSFFFFQAEDGIRDLLVTGVHSFALPIYEIAAVLDRHDIDIVFVTIPDAPRERLDELVAACDSAAVRCRFVRREIDLDPQVVLGPTLAE